MHHFFPLVWDNTQLNVAVNCPIKWFRNHVQHINADESVDLIAGRAFADGVHATRTAFYTEGYPADEAVAKGVEALYTSYGDYENQFSQHKSVHRMALALESYFDAYPLATDEVMPLQLSDDSHTLEYNIVVPILDMQGEPIMHPILDKPLLYSVRFDMLAEYMGGVWIVDEKTTGGYFTKNWPNEWQTRGQFSGYMWVLRHHEYFKDIPLVGAIIRGISLPRSTSASTQTQMDFYSNIQNIRHQQCLVHKSEHEVASWHRTMVSTIIRMKGAYCDYLNEGATRPEQHFTGNWGDYCTTYAKPCQFQETCKSAGGENFLEVLEQNIWLPNLAKRIPLEQHLQSLGLLEEANDLPTIIS